MADDDEIELTHDKILRRYGWAEGEREQQMAEMAARQREIDHRATVARCTSREAEPVIVTKSAPAPRRNTQAMTDVTAEWQSWARGEINRASKGWIEASMVAVGEMLIEERKRAADQRAKLRGEFELEVAKLRAELEVWQKMAVTLAPPATEVAAPKRKRVSPETAAEQRQRAALRVRRQALVS